ncbi:hypothetical protein HanRHA438_Chr01g0020271 [Helianthus annuus]|uniref:Rapid ALkalinization Factor n=1 Tax=Helianthus annuus TaxID=4232 RepID=A0A9K3JUV0_HELAN|nr:hypothetical protein HanXRQr2_Chr01g0019691 [Helianthus annuus]KAJ0622509.1 hypothetical protein HanIR_Chr01g0021511 [Helianthus annuus]KAJ0947816.1 hypothetical protein HanRHA438_Chr01g0020271 [Helianthus annuus]
MFNRRTSTTTILSLSIIMLVMMMMIKDCDGWLAACNGSTAAECLVVEVEEQEFMMDTEEHRRILGTSGPHLVYDPVLQRPGKGVCGINCAGRVTGGNGRTCSNTYARSC